MIAGLRRRAGLTPPPGASGGAGALDDSPPPIMAFSVARLLLSGWGSEPACVVRRPADPGSLDIGYVDGALDYAAALDYAEGGDLYVYSLRDNSGSGRDFIQPTEANQPKLVSGGALEIINGIPAMKFSNNAWMRWDGSLSAITALRQAWVVEIDPTLRFSFGRLCSWTKNHGSDFSDFGFMVADYRGTDILYGWQSNASSSKTSAGSGPKVIGASNSPSYMIVSSNGVAGSTLNISYPGFNQWTEITLGQTGMPSDPNNAWAGKIAEWVVWDQAANDEDFQAYIENAKTYWGIL